MIYESLGQGAQFPYPDMSIDPAKKGKDWCTQYAKAAYYDFQYSYPKGVFASNGGDYEKFRMYGLGKQPISMYKKMLGVDQQTNNTWLSIDWSVRSIVSGYRDKAISRLMKEDYSVVATPIDILAKTEETMFYSDMKAKLAVREMLIKQNPELASHPMIQLNTGEPLDLEEFQMRVELGEQFNRSKDAEMAIELGFYENNYSTIRRQWYEDLFDFGVAGVKDELGADNKAKFRRVNPERVIVSFCKDATFKDMVHAGEVIDVPLVELATITDDEGNRMFTDEDLTEFAMSLAGKFGNPATVGKNSGWFKPYDKFKCQVLDIEFLTYNTTSYRIAKDENGNYDVRKADFGRGKKSDKYKRKTIQYVYKCKWIVGTDKAYDWGMCYDQKRYNSPEAKGKTKLSYHFCAYNFYQMKAQGFMERLIPYLDEYQLTIYKIQNFKNRAVPSGWWIDLDALENVALSKGGAAMQPKELLQMFFDTGVLVGRSQDEAGNPKGPNWKPVIPIENTAASELAMFYQDLLNTVMTIEKITGYNDITSGNPNPKTLVPGYEMAQQSTNDALYPMAWAEETLTLSLAENVLLRMQQGLRKSGGLNGYAMALNTNSLRTISINPGIALRDYGIRLEKKTSDDQKMWLLQQMQQDIANGYLNTSDAVMLVNTRNAKEAQMIWAYRVRKEKERLQEYELQKIQMNNQGASEAAQVAAQLEAQKVDQEWNYKLQEQQMKLQAELAAKQMELQAQLQMKQLEMQVKYQIGAEQNDAKQYVADVTGQAKIIAADIEQDGKAVAAEIAGIHSQQKQEIANKKPAAPAKK